MNKFEDHNIPLKTVSSALMQAYLAGELSPRMQHAVEKFLLDNPFEAEALEGYAQNLPQLNELPALNERLELLIQEKQQKQVIPIWRQYLPYAASFLLLLVATITAVYYYGRGGSNAPISLEQDDNFQMEQLSSEKPSLPTLSSNEDQSDDTQDNFPKIMGPAKKAKQRAKNTQRAQKSDLPSPSVSAQEEIASVNVGKESEPQKEGFMRPMSPQNTEDTIEEEMAEVIIKAEDAVALETESLASKSIERSIRSKKTSSVEAVKAEKNPLPTQEEKAKPNDHWISGEVVDAESGEALPGVNVMLKGSNTGVTTDISGEFRIQANSGDILEFHYIGMDSKEVTVEEQSYLTVALSTDVQQLSEVVVTGHGKSEEQPSYLPARPVNGMKAYKQYLGEQLQYPEAAIKNKVEGKVKLKLTISSAGKIVRAEVIKSLSDACDAEAIRLVKEGPSWDPAVSNGEKKKSSTRLVVKFELKK